jgi:hypothetical protein
MQLPFRITVCGLDELAGRCEARISHVLSILDPEWPVPEAFGTFGDLKPEPTIIMTAGHRCGPRTGSPSLANTASSACCTE